jgi:ribosome maturation factor RimP
MDIKKLQAPLESQLSLLGLELVLLESARNGQDDVLRMYIEHKCHSKPVTLDDCATANDGLIAWMDAEFPTLRETACIEVSSPGAERPLATPSHYARFIGRLCKLNTIHPHNGQKRYKGWIYAVETSGVTLEEDGQLKHIPFSSIHKAKLAPFDEGSTPKPKYAAMAAGEQADAEKSVSKEA